MSEMLDGAPLPETTHVALLFGTRSKNAACISCRRLKQKCDNFLPCTRCVRNGRADSCRTEDTEATFVERPIIFNTSFLKFDSGIISPPKMLKKDWSYDTIVRLWSMGYRFHILEGFFNSIPSHLRSSMKKALHLMQDPQMQMALPTVQRMQLPMGETSQPSHVEDLCELMLREGAHWENHQDYGFFQVHLKQQALSTKGRDA